MEKIEFPKKTVITPQESPGITLGTCSGGGGVGCSIGIGCNGIICHGIGCGNGCINSRR